MVYAKTVKIGKFYLTQTLIDGSMTVEKGCHR